METKMKKMNCYKYTCELCDYHTSNKYNMNEHFMTPKPLMKENCTTNEPETSYKFHCAKCDYYTNNK